MKIFPQVARQSAVAIPGLATLVTAAVEAAAVIALSAMLAAISLATLSAPGGVARGTNLLLAWAASNFRGESDHRVLCEVVGSNATASGSRSRHKIEIRIFSSTVAQFAKRCVGFSFVSWCGWRLEIAGISSRILRAN